METSQLKSASYLHLLYTVCVCVCVWMYILLLLLLLLLLQVMVFVHARNETVRTATTLCDMAKNKGDITMFQPQQSPKYGDAEKQVRSFSLT